MDQRRQPGSPAASHRRRSHRYQHRHHPKFCYQLSDLNIFLGQLFNLLCCHFLLFPASKVKHLHSSPELDRRNFFFLLLFRLLHNLYCFKIFRLLVVFTSALSRVKLIGGIKTLSRCFGLEKPSDAGKKLKLYVRQHPNRRRR